MSIFGRAVARMRGADDVGIWPDQELPVDDPTLHCVAIGDAPLRISVRATGTIRSVLMQPQAGVPTLRARIDDGTGELTVTFLGRRQIGGITIGRAIVVEGVIGETRTGRQILNPVYRLL